MFFRFLKLCIAIALLVANAPLDSGAAAQVAFHADTTRIREDALALASPLLAGRRSGSPGNARARELLVERMAALGLEALPGARSFEQSFAVEGVELESLAGTLSGPDGESFPLVLSLSAPPLRLEQVRLAAWLENSAPPAVGPGTIVIRQGPGAGGGHFSPSTLLLEAEAAGAAGMILVPHPADSAGVFGRYLGRSRHRDPRLYQLAGQSPAPLLAYADGEAAGRLFDLALRAEADWRLALPAGEALVLEGVNLIGRQPATPDGAPVILLCAHYDHIGEGPAGVFPGADDNISGVATLLETTRLLSGCELPWDLRILFPDAEELGLLGARHFAEQAPAPALVINLDSVGRAAVDSYRKLGDPSALNARLMIQWANEGASGEAAALRQILAAAGFSPQAGRGPMFERGGDHWAFAERGIPSQFLFGGFHGDYNSVADLPERLSADRMGLLAEALASFLVGEGASR